jgi:hypothetical protein
MKCFDQSESLSVWINEREKNTTKATFLLPINDLICSICSISFIQMYQKYTAYTYTIHQ